jgi:hypothetical protein
VPFERFSDWAGFTVGPVWAETLDALQGKGCGDRRRLERRG